MKRGVWLLVLVSASAAFASCSSKHIGSVKGSAGHAAGLAGEPSDGSEGHTGGNASAGTGGAHAGSRTIPEGGAASISGGAGGSGDGGASGMTAEAGAGGAIQDPTSCADRKLGDIGGPCQNDLSCESAPGAADGTCMSPSLGYLDMPSEGYCVGGAFDTCPSSCQAAACAASDVCVDWAGCKACLPACCAGSTCGGSLVCATSIGDIELGAPVCVPGKLGAGLHSPCSDVGDCGPGLTCVATQERPGGECTKACTAGNDTTCPANAHCVFDALYPRCAKACQGAADCRGAEGYACVDLGGNKGKVCKHPQVGDTCANDDDCGGGAWHCQTGANFTGGYCTFTDCPTAGSETGCPSLSAVCFDPAVGSNYCVDRCATVGSSSSCRAGYDCKDVDPSAVTSGGCVPL